VALLLAIAAAGCGGAPVVDPGPAATSPSPAATSPAASSPAAAVPSATGSPAGSPGGSPGTSPPGAPATAARYVFPVEGHASYARTHAPYPATDIFAACGAPVRAVTDGVVLEVSRTDTFDPARPAGADRGGLSVSLRGDDGVRYYGSHLSSIAAGVAPGARLRAGDPVGSVGRTGNASNICHLHFGVSPPCETPGDWWVRRGVVWPWPYLDAWRGGRATPAAADEVRAWQLRNGCPKTPPPGER
jgi:murein DD-endopeptidase MepM/ murein hydrolase activator NlpD